MSDTQVYDAHAGAQMEAELANARNVIPHAGGARLLAVCPSGLAPGASADIVLRPEDLLAAWRA